MKKIPSIMKSLQLCFKHVSEQILAKIWCLKHKKLSIQNRHLNLNSTHCALQEWRRAPLPLPRHGHVHWPLLYCRPCWVHYMGGRAECFHWNIPQGKLHQNWTLLPPQLDHLCWRKTSTRRGELYGGVDGGLKWTCIFLGQGGGCGFQEARRKGNQSRVQNKGWKLGLGGCGLYKESLSKISKF